MSGGQEVPVLEKSRLRLYFVFAIALAFLALSVLGGLGGCNKKKGGWGQEQEEGNGDNGNTETEGFKGIAFVRDDYIYLGDEEGMDERRLTSSAAGYGDLAFSPSGNTLAATKIEGDAMPQLILVDVESGKVTDVSWTNEDYSMAWTEAGVDPWFGDICWASEKILYCTAAKSVGGQFQYSVVKYDLSIPEVDIVENDACNPALSPSGKKLAYIVKPADWYEIPGQPWDTLQPGDLMVMDLPGGTATKVSVNRDGAYRGYIFDAAFSPDGKHMVVDCFDEPDCELYYTDLEGGILYALDMVGPAGRTGHPSFSPDGSYVIYHIAYRDMPEQPYGYTMLIAPTGAANPEVVDLGEGADPAWSPVK
jgi:Tol biopolymer transport system component